LAGLPFWGIEAPLKFQVLERDPEKLGSRFSGEIAPMHDQKKSHEPS
jgi:hypothetical protein